MDEHNRDKMNISYQNSAVASNLKVFCEQSAYEIRASKVNHLNRPWLKIGCRYKSFVRGYSGGTKHKATSSEAARRAPGGSVFDNGCLNVDLVESLKTRQVGFNERTMVCTASIQRQAIFINLQRSS